MLFAQAAEAIVVCDYEGLIIEINPAACELLGKPRTKLVTHALGTFVPGLNLSSPRIHPTGLHRLQNGSSPHRLVEIKTLRLTDAFVACYLRPGPDPVAPPPITDHEAALLRATIETMADGILIVSASGRITHFNHRFLEIWSIPPDHPAVLNRDDAGLIELVSNQIPASENFPQRIAEIYRSQDRTEDLVRCHDGRVIERISFPLVQASGAEAERIWQFRDITARKHQEEANTRRLEALIHPQQTPPDNITFEELFDLAEIQNIQDQFAQATGVASIITHVDGTPITRPSNFCRLCKDIIRQTPLGEMNCHCSDAIIGRHHPDGPIIQPCMSGGLWDAGASIIADGRHIANWLIGQVRNETQTEDRMREYARTIGADEETLVEAFREVPTMPQEQFQRVAQALFTLANQLSKIALQNLQQARHIAERKRVEWMLESNLQETQRLMQSMANAFVVWGMIFNEEGRGVDLRFDYFNDAYAQMAGLTFAEAQGKRVREVWPDTEPAWFEIYEEVARTGISRRFELPHAPTHGIYAGTAYRPGESPDRVCAVFEEITERKQAEQVLRESEQLFRHMFEDNRAVMFLIDPDTGLIAEANPAAAEFYGYSRDELCGMRIDRINALPFEEVRQKLQQAVGGKHDNFIFPHRLASGEVRTVEVRASSVAVSGRRLVFSIIQDVTERKWAEAQLHRTTQWLLHTQRISQVGGWTIDPVTRVVWISPEARRIYGIPPNAETTLDYIKAFPLSQYRPILDRAFKELLEEGKPYDVEFQIRRGTDGTIVDIHSVAEFDATEGAVLGVIHDVTARHQAEQERLELERKLLHSQKLESLGVLAGGIAHDFNNLLMAILANLDLARLDLPPDSPALESIEQSISASRRAADLTQQMLNYSGRGSFVMQNIDVSALVTENAHLFRACISHLIRFEIETAANQPFILADPGQVQQVVMNLITNASEAIGEKPGVIRLRTYVEDFDAHDLRSGRANVTPPAGRYVVIEVTDSGCGMDLSTQQRLFDPFFTTKFTGRGLGMAAMLGIVSAHHGTILVDSTAGQGSTIRVLFPARGTPVPACPASSPNLPALDTANALPVGTILIVDDDESVRHACQRMLTKQGWQVLEAVDGPQAVELVKQHATNLMCVILDLTMPSMSGVDVFRVMRKMRPDLRIVLTSGYSQDESISAQLAHEGLAGFIQKPFSSQSLLQALSKAFRRG